jgi:hypothetical protein
MNYNNIMKATFFSLLAGVLLFASCKNSRQISSSLPYPIDLEKSIDNVKIIPLSAIGKELQYIPLETNQDCLIKRIDQIVFSDSFIFISDARKLLQFKRNGRFVRQIGSIGRGPGEYEVIWDICTDKSKEFIYIIAGKGNVVVFDFKGHYLRSFMQPERSEQFIMKDSESLMFYSINISMPSNDKAYSWYIVDTNGVVLSRIKNCLKRNSKFVIRTSPLYLFNETAHFMEFGIDTLYYFNNSTKQPYAIFNLGDIKMDPDPDPKYKLHQKFYLYKIIEDREYMYLNLQSSFGSIVPGLFNKQTSELIIPENDGFLNNIDGGPVFWPNSIYKDSILIDFIDAFKLLDFINKKIASESGKTDKNNQDRFESLKKQLTETSNPVLMIVK